jgi:hypothetical protein
MHIRVSQFAWQQTSKQKPYGPTESDMNFHSTEGKKNLPTETTVLSKVILYKWRREKEIPKQKLREYISTSCVLQEMLKEVLQTERDINKQELNIEKDKTQW